MSPHKWSHRSRKDGVTCAPSQTVLEGNAYLCFAEDESWFQGCLLTSDNNSYDVCGSRRARKISGILSRSPTEQKEVIPKSTDTVKMQVQKPLCVEDTQGKVMMRVPVVYNVTMFDEETGEEHNIDNVKEYIGEDGQIVVLQCNNVQFDTNNVHKGNKADVIIQEHLGNALVDRNCHVYEGHLKLSYTEQQFEKHEACDGI